MTHTKSDEMIAEYPDPNSHQHSHSLYVKCMNCGLFGIDMPTPFIQAAECGNCTSMQTIKYYPSCCMMAAFEQGLTHERARSAKLVAVMKAIYSEAQKGDGTTSECEMAAQAEQALAAHHESEEK